MRTVNDLLALAIGSKYVEESVSKETKYQASRQSFRILSNLLLSLKVESYELIQSTLDCQYRCQFERSVQKSGRRRPVDGHPYQEIRQTESGFDEDSNRLPGLDPQQNQTGKLLSRGNTFCFGFKSEIN